MLTALCTRWLERIGYVVLDPDFLRAENVHANIGPFTVLRRNSPFRVISEDTRTLRLGEKAVPVDAEIVPPGFTLVPLEPAPALGWHVPTTGLALARYVDRVKAGEVHYHTRDMTPRSCQVGSFNKWAKAHKVQLMGEGESHG